MIKTNYYAPHPRGRTLYYPPSELLAGLEWTGEPYHYPGSGSDMHWWTWADDDAIYTVDDDGSNFGGPWHYAHLLKVTGMPPDHVVTPVSQFPELRREGLPLQKVRYVDGMLAVGSRLYVAAYDYSFDDPLRQTYRMDAQSHPKGIGADPWFINAISQHMGVASLMFSDDYGQNWQNVPTVDTPYFLGSRFAGLAFVGFGPGYTGVPAWLGDYVYAISNDENWENGNYIFLARVPKDRVLEREAWKFYGGGNGRDAVWIANEWEAVPILADPGHAGHPTMTYNPGLQRFLLAYGCDSVPHNYAIPRAFARQHWHRARELHLLESPTPWGPWGVVHYDPFWEGEHLAYLPQMPSKWLSEDGLSGTLLYSGDYTVQPPRYKGEQSYYGFMTRPFRLITR